MVGLKQKENCETKRDKRPPSYIGGAKMAKIFATKTLSMVLCFVMLFMGAPVTTWATVGQRVEVTTGDTTLAWNDSTPSSVSLTATGFASGASYSWALSTGADTYVRLDVSTDTATVKYNKSVVESPREITVMVTDTNGEGAQASITLLLLPAGQCLVIRDKDGKLVTGDPSLASVGDSLTFEAHGFGAGALTDFNWMDVSDEMKTFVTTSTLNKKGLKLELKALPAFDVKLPVKAKGTQGAGDYTSQEVTVMVNLNTPSAFNLFMPSGVRVSNGVWSPTLTAPNSDYTFLVFTDGLDDVTQDVAWASSVPEVASVDKGKFDIKTAGSTVISATYDDTTVAFLLKVNSGIGRVSIVPPESTTVAPGNTVPLTAKAFADTEGQPEITELGDKPFAWSITDGKSYAEVDDSGKVTFKAGSAGQTVKVKATSTFDQSKSSPEMTFTVGWTEATPEAPEVDDFTVTDADDNVILAKGVAAGELTLPFVYGGTHQLSPQALDAEGEPMEAEFTWASDDEDVVTVGETTGLLTIVGAGTATLTVTADEVEKTIDVTVEKAEAEVKVYSDADKKTPVSGSFTVPSDGDKALYVYPVLKGSTTGIADVDWDVTLDETSLPVGADGKIDLSTAKDGQKLTIKAEHPNYDFGVGVVLTINVEAAAPPVQVYGVDVWRTDDLNMSTVTALTLGVSGTVGLTASVDGSGSDNGVTWSSDKPSVVSVSGTGYAATLTAKAVGTATITVTSVDDPYVTRTVAVTVKKAVDLSFTPHAGVYNKDLWGDKFASEARARYARMIGTVPTGTDLTQFTTISIKDSSGEFVVEEEPSTNYLTDVSDDVAAWAAQLREARLLDSDALPVCFMNYVMPDFELGEYDITLTTLSGQEFTTSINIVDNDFYEDASWTTGSSEGLLIAKMPGITNDLLVALISDLKILKDGTHLLKDKGNTEILEANSDTGNVYIKKEILDTLEAGTYSIGFTVVGNEELLNFTVVDHRAAWGAPMTRLADRKVQYVDAAGKASIELTSENLANGILWLLEESGGTSAWYGIDLSTGAFELDKGSRFYVQWLHKDDAEYDTYYAQLDDEQQSQIENGWIFLIGVEDASGNKIQPAQPANVEEKPSVNLYVQIGADWDLDELKAYYIAAGDDQSVDVEDILGFAYPEGEDEFGMMTLSHFSPYLIMDELSDAERGVVVQGSGSGSGSGYNNKTGDQAVQIAVAGLGSILVLALGIMLRLITSKKKFEE